MVIVIALIMFLFLILGFPLFFPLMMGTFTGFFLLFDNLNPVIVAQQMIGGVTPASLIAVPMFIFAADIMTKGHTANRLLDFVRSFIGHIRGGLPITTALSCALFGAVSGSTQATVVAIGKPLRPRMMKKGYSEAFTNALIINASDIALLIPPSIGMIVYGVVTGTSIGELFIGGVGPGLLLMGLFSLYAYFYAVVKKISMMEKASWSERRKRTKEALLPMGFPVIIIGGIYGGIFSPTEAASVSVAYAFLLETVIYKQVKIDDYFEIAVSTGLITAVVFLLVGAGSAFSWMISYAEIPQQILYEGIGLSSESSPIKLLFIMSLAYFVGCMFVDPIVVILILAPVFHPLVVSAGVDPVHAGVLVTLQAAIGSATPPFGCDIFTAVAVFKRPYAKIVAGTPPFIFLLVFASVLMIYFPSITLFLRDLSFR